MGSPWVHHHQPQAQSPGPWAGPGTEQSLSGGPSRASARRRTDVVERGGPVLGDCGVTPGACPLPVTSVTSR